MDWYDIHDDGNAHIYATLCTEQDYDEDVTGLRVRASSPQEAVWTYMANYNYLSPPAEEYEDREREEPSQWNESMYQSPSKQQYESMVRNLKRISQE